MYEKNLMRKCLNHYMCRKDMRKSLKLDTKRGYAKGDNLAFVEFYIFAKQTASRAPKRKRRREAQQGEINEN